MYDYDPMWEEDYSHNFLGLPDEESDVALHFIDAGNFDVWGWDEFWDAVVWLMDDEIQFERITDKHLRHSRHCFRRTRRRRQKRMKRPHAHWSDKWIKDFWHGEEASCMRRLQMQPYQRHKSKRATEQEVQEHDLWQWEDFQEELQEEEAEWKERIEAIERQAREELDLDPENEFENDPASSQSIFLSIEEVDDDEDDWDYDIIFRDEDFEDFQDDIEDEVADDDWARS